MSEKAGIKKASQKTGMSMHYLYTEARAGRIPVIRSGAKYIFDIELLEEFLRTEALNNVKREENAADYGKLRRINP